MSTNDENSELTLDEEEGIIELEDEDGNVSRFEFIDRMEFRGGIYYALVPADYDEEEGATEFIILKETVVNAHKASDPRDENDTVDIPWVLAKNLFNS